MSERPIKLGYALTRVSTPKQALVQHGSLEQQRHIIERWVEAQSARSSCEYRIVKYIAEDISGRAASLKKRHGMHELERAIERREIDFFVAEKIDRIGRDQVHNLQLVRRAHELGIEVFEVESGQINFRDRGSRIGFNVKNWLSEEYSWDLEEKITKKIREARVNNSKDNRTIPILGLDPHPTKVGKYVRNEDEIAIVLTIANKFLEAKSYKPVIEYCRKQGYKTKARYTKEKIDAEGNRIPPRLIGGQAFDEDALRDLLQNGKLRGFSKFKDTWSQFPKLQDEESFVTWRYEHGSIIDEETADRIDAIVASFQHKKPRRGKYNDFLLTGVLEAADGSRFHGEAAKSGEHNYYRNSRNNKLRFRCAHLDSLVVARVKCYLEEDGYLQRVYEKSMRASQVGEPAWRQQRVRLQGRARELETVVANFSRSVRELAAGGTTGKDLAEVVESLLKEKKAAEAELVEVQGQLRTLEVREQQLQATLQGQTLRLFLKKSMSRFDQLPAREQKRVIQSVVIKAIVLDDSTLDLTLCPDPANPEAWENKMITARDQEPDPGRNVEFSFSRCAGNGGPFQMLHERSSSL